MPSGEGEVLLSYAPLVDEVAPAVVNVYSARTVRERRSGFFEDPIFRRFFGENFSFGIPRERVQRSLGSGVIVRSSGVIVTNNHVIGDADTIQVVLADRREFDAEVILTDPRTDLAVLRIDTKGEEMPVANLGDSDEVAVGDIVLAIGNPFGIGQTVTSGIVSATARTQAGISDFGFFLQTDAAVNPGNSGGALVALTGQVMGINTAIYSRTGANNGIGFAIPANMVRSVVTAALEEGVVIRPWLGISGQTVTSDLADALGLDRPGGVLIDSLYLGGPASNAGLRAGDVILEVDGRDVVDEQGLRFRIATESAGEEVDVTIVRDGDVLRVPVELELLPERPERNVTTLEGRHPFQGVTVGNLSPRFAEELGLDPMRDGVVALEVARRSPAGRLGFVRPGDIIVNVQNERIGSVEDLKDIADRDWEQWLYRVERGGRQLDCAVFRNGAVDCRLSG